MGGLSSVVRRPGADPGGDPLDLCGGEEGRPVPGHAGAGDVGVAADLLEEIAPLRVARLDAGEARVLLRGAADDLPVALAGGEDHPAGGDARDVAARLGAARGEDLR